MGAQKEIASEREKADKESQFTQEEQKIIGKIIFQIKKSKAENMNLNDNEIKNLVKGANDKLIDGARRQMESFQKYLKYKSKYISLKKSQNGGGNHEKSKKKTNEYVWTNKNAEEKANELTGIFGPPTHTCIDSKNNIEYVKWQQDLDNDNFKYNAYHGVDMIKITNYAPNKLHPYEAPVYVIVGKFMKVPDSLLGPLKYASETINIEQLSVPKNINEEYIKSKGNKELALVTGSCASVTISVITLQFVHDMVENDKAKEFKKIGQETYDNYRKSYDDAIHNYLCEGKIEPKIDSDFFKKFSPEKFKEKAKIVKLDDCEYKKN